MSRSSAKMVFIHSFIHPFIHPFIHSILFIIMTHYHIFIDLFIIIIILFYCLLYWRHTYGITKWPNMSSMGFDPILSTLHVPMGHAPSAAHQRCWLRSEQTRMFEIIISLDKCISLVRDVTPDDLEITVTLYQIKYHRRPCISLPLLFHCCCCCCCCCCYCCCCCCYWSSCYDSSWSSYSCSYCCCYQY